VRHKGPSNLISSFYYGRDTNGFHASGTVKIIFKRWRLAPRAFLCSEPDTPSHVVSMADAMPWIGLLLSSAFVNKPDFQFHPISAV